MTWQRLESSTVGADLLEGPEARIADGLWMIGRQWQVGELTGDDAASPLLVDAQIEHTPVSRFQPGSPDDGFATVDLRGAQLPLEAMVEGEDVLNTVAATRLAAESGLQFLRFLGGRGGKRMRALLRSTYPLDLPDDDGLDPVGRAELELLVERSFDGRALRADTAPAEELMKGPSFARWSAWYDMLYGAPVDASWQERRMEYRFRVAGRPKGDNEIVLDAPEYVGGHLDWYSFNVANDAPAMGAEARTATRRIKAIPTNTTFSGQAASRWWEMEDASVWFGDIAAAPEDLARVALASFGLTFGDDYFVIPCRIPVGHLVRAGVVRVRDTFGATHRIRSSAELDGPDRVWRFFELTGDASADAADLRDRSCPWMFLAPAVAGVTESAPREEVSLLRDEVANVGWAAELRVEAASGRVIDRAARARAAMHPDESAITEAWKYSLTQPVPGHLVPLLPVQVEGEAGLYLQRGRLAHESDAGGIETQGAVGEILEAHRQLFIEDAEVPASGVNVTRSWQMARTSGGRFALWMGRRKGIPRPRKVPAVRFDAVDPRSE